MAQLGILLRILHVFSHDKQITALILQLDIDVLGNRINVDQQTDNVVNRCFTRLNKVLHLIHLRFLIFAIDNNYKLTRLLRTAAVMAGPRSSQHRSIHGYNKQYKLTFNFVSVTPSLSSLVQ